MAKLGLQYHHEAKEGHKYYLRQSKQETGCFSVWEKPSWTHKRQGKKSAMTNHQETKSGLEDHLRARPEQTNFKGTVMCRQIQYGTAVSSRGKVWIEDHLRAMSGAKAAFKRKAWTTMPWGVKSLIEQRLRGWTKGLLRLNLRLQGSN